MKKYIFCSLLFSVAFFLQSNGIYGQNLSLGFKAGLSLSSFNDDSEVDAQGNEVENFKEQTGFHIGILGRYRFYDDLFGVRFGLIYNQRGGRIDYDGPSYFIFNPEDPTYAVGNRKEEIRFSNVYLDIPIEGMVFIGRKLEISAGGYIGFLVGSSGSGNLNFSGRSLQTNNNIEDFSVFYDFEPFNDGAGLDSYLEQQTITVDGRNKIAPIEAGTYYEFAEKDGNYLNWIDVGLTGGLTYFINEGLYFNAQFKYGLNEVIRDPYYISKLELDEDRNFIKRDGNRSNMTLMLSLGFAF